MKFGLLYEMQRAMEGGEVDEYALVKETLEQCRLADEMGFDYLWFVEHHFLTGFSGSPCNEVMFGALSQITKQIRIGFGVAILPYHHPIQVAERVAMLDLLTAGRIELGTGRSNAYEQMGLGVDPRDTREMWEESITMIPKIWESGEFEYEGKFWKVPSRRVLPKPLQKPHPNMYLTSLQQSGYDLAAEKGLGVLASNSYAISVLADIVKRYKEKVVHATPVGAFINNHWANNIQAHCGPDNREARDLCERSLKQFFGPDKPYTRGRVGIYEDLLEAWGGVPDHLDQEFSRWLRKSDEEHRALATEVGVNIDAGYAAARYALESLDADTLVDRGVIIAGDPESCIQGIRKYEEIGVDQLIMLMQTESVPHEKVMGSLEMFGKHVLPVFKAEERTKAAAGAR